MTAISALAGARLYFDSNVFINALESPDHALRAQRDQHAEIKRDCIYSLGID